MNISKTEPKGQHDRRTGHVLHNHSPLPPSRPIRGHARVDADGYRGGGGVGDKTTEGGERGMTYAIVFLNEKTWKVGLDFFNGTSEGDAKHGFRECYRHGTYKILSVVEVPERPEGGETDGE